MVSWFNRELAVWLVPTRSGIVRRFRVTPALVGVCGVIVCGLSYLGYSAIQEYRLLQTQRLYHATIEQAFLASKSEASRELSLTRRQLSAVSSDRDVLKDNARRMQSKLEALTDAIRGVRSYLGASSKSDEVTKGGARGGGVGGAEIPVSPDEGLRMGMFSPTRFAKQGRVDRSQSMPKLDSLLDEIARLPVTPPVKGAVTSRFGFRRSPFHKGVSRHQGLDISARYGEPIVAPADAVVMKVARHPTYGLMVDLGHSGALATRFAHMSRASVVEGQRIKRGDRIGYVGTSGRSTGPHVHFEVRYKAEAIDPEPFLKAGQRLASLSELR